MNKIISLFAFLFLVALSINNSAFAHTGGFTYETTVGNYFIDVGASKLTLAPNELTLFEYNIFTTSDPNNLADFDRVYVTIGDSEQVLLSTYVHRPEGLLTTLSFSFPKAKQYEMTARFQKGEEVMAEVSFPLQVQGNGIDSQTIKVGVLFALLGMAIGFGLARFRNRKNLAVDNSTNKTQ